MKILQSSGRGEAGGGGGNNDELKCEQICQIYNHLKI